MRSSIRLSDARQPIRPQTLGYPLCSTARDDEVASDVVLMGVNRWPQGRETGAD